MIHHEMSWCIMQLQMVSVKSPGKHTALVNKNNITPYKRILKDQKPLKVCHEYFPSNIRKICWKHEKNIITSFATQTGDVITSLPQKKLRNVNEPQKKTVIKHCFFSGISFPNKNCMYTSHILSVWDFSEAQPKNIQVKMAHN